MTNDARQIAEAVYLAAERFFDDEPELMYKLGTGHFTDLSALTAAIRDFKKARNK